MLDLKNNGLTLTGEGARMLAEACATSFLAWERCSFEVIGQLVKDVGSPQQIDSDSILFWLLRVAGVVAAQRCSSED